MQPRYRLLGIVVLVILTGGLCVQYAATDHWAYPETEAVAAEPEAYDGEQLLLFGEVKAVTETTILIEIPTDPQSLELTVEGAPPDVIGSVTPGGEIQVSGTLRADGTTIVADRVVADFRSPGDFRYVYATSVLGAMLAAGYFLWYWRIDPRRLRFVRRGEP